MSKENQNSRIAISYIIEEICRRIGMAHNAAALIVSEYNAIEELSITDDTTYYRGSFTYQSMDKTDRLKQVAYMQTEITKFEIPRYNPCYKVRVGLSQFDHWDQADEFTYFERLFPDECLRNQYAVDDICSDLGINCLATLLDSDRLAEIQEEKQQKLQEQRYHQQMQQRFICSLAAVAKHLGYQNQLAAILTDKVPENFQLEEDKLNSLAADVQQDQKEMSTKLSETFQKFDLL